ncbi:cytochrome C assembly family protein [Lentisalinibacter salinarum]|uniref:cytochrome C assembly family protein n=1 Tax=Lentisalinibacter salinarum TaxID=2992239 RepID=UPI0038640437
MFQITVLALYAGAGCLLAAGQMPKYEHRHEVLFWFSLPLALAGLLAHEQMLAREILVGDALRLSIFSMTSLAGWQVAILATLAALRERLRGLSAILFLVAGVAALGTGFSNEANVTSSLTWQLRTHVMLSMFAYSLLAVGAVLAFAALHQDRLLRKAKMGLYTRLMPPLETMESLLYGVATAGFLCLLLAVFSGLVRVENLFAQHLLHKSVLSFIALGLFGLLLIGRQLAGWRGRRAIYLYLGGFFTLVLAYYGSKIVLEYILHRPWG